MCCKMLTILLLSLISASAQGSSCVAITQRPKDSTINIGGGIWDTYSGCSGPDANIPNCSSTGGCTSGVSRHECARMCMARSDCGGFGHEATGGDSHCWLKLKFTGGSQKAYLYCREWARQHGYTFYVKPCNCMAITERPKDSTINIGGGIWDTYSGCSGPDTNIPNCGSTGGCTSGVSRHECALKCMARSDCGGFGHEAAGGDSHCWLKPIFTGGSQKAYLYCREWARQNGYTFYVKPCTGSATANGRRVLESDECPQECEWDAENELCECEDGDVQAGHVYEEFGRSQCVTSWTPYAGDRKDNPIFGGGGFDMVGTALACKTKCD